LIFPNGGKYIKISDVKNTCNFEKMQNTLTNINAKWLNSEGDTTIISDLTIDTRYLTSDEGTTWQVDTTDRIAEDDITMLVLGTVSLKDAYLKPFDEETAEQLINIIGQ
jgi:transcriptional regulator CtsR